MLLELSGRLRRGSRGGGFRLPLFSFGCTGGGDGGLGQRDDFCGCGGWNSDGGDSGRCGDGGWSGFALSDLSSEAFAAADTFEEEFGNVFDRDVVGVGLAGSAAEHALAEGAAYSEDFFSGC